MKHFYTIFDTDNARIGLSLSVNGEGTISENAIDIPGWAIPALIMLDIVLLVVTSLIVIQVHKLVFKKKVEQKKHEQLFSDNKNSFSNTSNERVDLEEEEKEEIYDKNQRKQSDEIVEHLAIN